MLVRYLPEQVSEHWDSFAPYLADSLPPLTSQTLDGMTNMLRSILFNDLKLWVYYDGKDEDSPAIYVLTTITQIDRVTLQRSLLIYTATAIREIKARHWEEGFETIKKFAISEDCSSVIAYVKDPRVLKYLQSTGAKTEYTLVEMEV